MSVSLQGSPTDSLTLNPKGAQAFPGAGSEGGSMLPRKASGHAAI